MARQLEAKRARHAPGFYKDLHERSTADLLNVFITSKVKISILHSHMAGNDVITV